MFKFRYALTLIAKVLKAFSEQMLQYVCVETLFPLQFCNPPPKTSGRPGEYLH